MKYPLLFSLALACAAPLSAQIVVSGYMANPAGTDSPYEYVQLIATQDINFASTNYSVVWANNGTAVANGWTAGGTVSYGFNLTSGSVTAGSVFYVGGSGELINGSGSTDISSATWIRTINTGTTGGDGFGTAASGGPMGNGGTQADGIAVFSGLTASLTSTTTPVDAVFFGSGVGTAKPATGGYTLPNNDHYSSAQGTFGNGTNTFVFSDPAGSQYTSLTGTFNTQTNNWDTARTSALTTFTSATAMSALAPNISFVPEPSTAAAFLGVLALAGAWVRRRAVRA